MKNKGFTLTEIIIVLVIIAILVAIAMPIYHQRMLKAQRSDGKLALMTLATAMEKYYGTHHTFKTATIGKDDPKTDVLSSAKSPEGYYQLRIITQDKDSFVIEAHPLGKLVKEDVKCGSFRLNHMGNRSITGHGTLQECWQ
jgi:type IV pilus assembly protein PilE